MSKIAIFTNSVSDISPALAEEFKIHIVPDVIVFEGKEYLNNIDITPPELYQKIAVCEKLPTTSHPNVSIYIDSFQSAADCDAIICINLTSKMSGSYSTANTAKNMLKEQGFVPEIYVYDSLQVSFGLATMVLEAARMAQAQCEPSAILARLDELKTKIGVYFVMESLQNARKGGRVGAIRVLAADLLNVKPILMFRDGLVRDVGIVHGFDEAVSRVIDHYMNQAKRGGEVFIFHANREALAKSVANRLKGIDPAIRVRIEWVGAVIGIYTGEGCLGIAFQE